MFAAIARAVFGTANDRSLKAYQRRVPQINALEPAMAALSDEKRPWRIVVGVRCSSDDDQHPEAGADQASE